MFVLVLKIQEVPLMSTPTFPYPSRKNIHLKQSVYEENGLYFITICTRDKQCLLGFIEDDFLHPTETGNIVTEEIHALENSRPGLTIPQFVVMPNHIHLLVARERTARGKIPTLERFIGMLKANVTKRCGASIWQRGYYDHIVRTENDLVQIREYIRNNPRKWELDQEYRKN